MANVCYNLLSMTGNLILRTTPITKPIVHPASVVVFMLSSIVSLDKISKSKSAQNEFITKCNKNIFKNTSKTYL